MKRYMALILSTVVGVCIFGCNRRENTGEFRYPIKHEATSPEIKAAFETPVLVHSNGKQVEPYVMMLHSKTHSEFGWVIGDRPNISDMLSQKGSELPVLVYGDDFTIFYRDESISFLSLTIYNEQLEVVCENAPETVLAELPKENYYLGISVSEQGEYIESEGEYETTVYGCLYRLVKSNHGQAVMVNLVAPIGDGAPSGWADLSAEDAATLSGIIESGEWTEGSSDCLQDIVILLEGRLFYYHSECGTFEKIKLSEISTLSFKEPAPNSTLVLDEKTKHLVNTILGKYIVIASEG